MLLAAMPMPEAVADAQVVGHFGDRRHHRHLAPIRPADLITRTRAQTTADPLTAIAIAAVRQ